MALLIEAGADVNAQRRRVGGHRSTPHRHRPPRSFRTSRPSSVPLVKLEHPAKILARFEAAAILLRDAGAMLGLLEAWRRQGWPAPEDQGLARGACGASSNESPGLHE